MILCKQNLWRDDLIEVQYFTYVQWKLFIEVLIHWRKSKEITIKHSQDILCLLHLSSSLYNIYFPTLALSIERDK